MSVLYIMSMSMHKIRFMGLTVWSPIGNYKQTHILCFINIDTSSVRPLCWSRKAITLGEVYDAIGSDGTTASFVNYVIGSSFYLGCSF